MPRPANYRAGLDKGRLTQKASARRHDREIWDWLIIIAVCENPRTLREYAAFLTEAGVPTRRGGQWTTGLVDRVLRSRKLNPKKLLERVRRPPHTEPMGWPQEIYAAYGRAKEATESGRWVPVLSREPERLDLVRHPDHGEGQMVRPTRLGRYLCSFVNEDGSFEVECPAASLEAFRFDLSREQMIAKQERLHAQFFRPDQRIRLRRVTK